jgi:hypothetical protein
MRCKNGTRKKKGECVPYPFTTRCKKGTHKKNGECKPFAIIHKEYIDSIIKEYQLKPGADTYLRNIKLTKRSTDFYDYDAKRSDLDNLYFKVRARVAEILKFGDAKEKSLIL